MSQSIQWSFDAGVRNGPRLSGRRDLDVDAYDRIDATLPAQTGTNGTTVEVQPGNQDVRFLLITADRYSSGLVYDVEDASGNSGRQGVSLDAEHTFVEKGRSVCSGW